MSDLLKLAERCEAATGPDKALDAAICVALQYGGANSEGATGVRTDPDDADYLLFEIGDEDCCNPIPPLTASLDAAMTLAVQGISAADVLRHAITRCTRYGCPTFIEALPRFVASEWLRARASMSHGQSREAN